MADQQGPSPEDITRQEELNRLREENNRLERESREVQRDQAAISNGLIDDLKEVLGIRSRTTQTEKQTLKLNTDINNAVNKTVTGFGSVKSLTKDIEKNQKLITQAANKTRGIEENLGKTQTKRLNAARNLADEITNQNDKVEEMQAAMLRGEEIDQKELRAEKEKLVGLDKRFAALQENLSTEAQQVLLTEQQRKALEEVTAEMAKELELQKKIENSFGVFGGVAKALGELPVVGRAFTGALSNAKGRVAEIVKETGKIPSRFKRASIFAGEFSKIVSAAAVGFIVKQALKLNSSFVDISRTLGVSSSEVRKINQELRDTEAASDNIYTTDTERLATLNKINQTLGMNAQILGNENVAGAARLEQSIGLAAEDAQALALNAGIAGENIMDVTKEVIKTTNEFNDSNKTLYNSKGVLQDVAKVSTNIKTIYGFNTKELTKSVLEAKKLGLTLDEVAGIGKNLLDFESSIQAELEAELLTGKQLNLEKARQAALNNDLKTLGEEISKQGLTMSEYSKLGAIGQEKMAAAMGMTQEQLAKTVQQEELRRLGKERFAELHGKETLESMEQLKVQESLEKSLAKMAQGITPVVEFMARLFSHTEAVYGVMVAIGAISFVRVISGIITMATSLGASAAGAIATASALTLGIGIAAIVAGIYAASSAAESSADKMKAKAQKVKDGMIPPGKGPFTITDNFGATAITDEGDGIAVSPNIKRKTTPKVQGPAVGQEAGIPITEPGKPALAAGGGSADMGPVVAAINELIATVKAGGTIEIDGQAVGRAVTLVDYQTGGG